MRKKSNLSFFLKTVIKIRIIGLFIAIVVVFGCAAMPGKIEAPYKVGDVISAETGTVVTDEFLSNELLHSRIVFIGETHVNPDHHRAQLDIIQALNRKGAQLAIGMEMFPREKQTILNQWVAGDLTEKQFLELVEWEEVWGYPFSLYRDILFFARDNSIPIFGLNAPREIVRKTGDVGLDNLDEQDRERIAADIRLNNEAHRQVIKERFADHPSTDSDFERFYQAQRVWDETMAETTVQALSDSSTAPDIIVVLAGTGHMLYRLGIPDGIARRTDYHFVVIAPATVGDAGLLVEDNAADYIRVSAPTPPRPHRPMIGVGLDSQQLKKGVLVVDRIMKGSPAETMGLAKGDIILKVNNQEAHSAKDIHNALTKSSDKKNHSIMIDRAGDVITQSFELPLEESRNSQ